MNSNFTPINNSNQLKSDNYFLNSSFPISINSNKSSNENQINLNMSFSKKNNFQIKKIQKIVQIFYINLIISI